MIRRREAHWQSAAERAQVAAELMEEAESLTASGIATPAEVKRSKLPPPLRIDLTPRPVAPAEPPDDPAVDETPSAVSAAPLPPHLAAREAAARGDWDGAFALLNESLAAAPDDVLLLLERSAVLSASGDYAV